MSLPGQFLQSTYLCSHRPRDAVAVVGARSQYDGNGGYAAAGAWCKDARCLSQTGWNMMKSYTIVGNVMLNFLGGGAGFFVRRWLLFLLVRFRLCFFLMTLCRCVCCDLSWSLSVHGFVCLVTWSAFHNFCVDSYGESFLGVSGVVQFVNVMMWWFLLILSVTFFFQ